jgi:CheY-like chemotaxis protein
MSKPVMIVDDDPDVMLTTQTILESAGFSVITAETGAACLSLIRNGFKGVILLDVMIPDYDGWTVIRMMVEQGLAEGNLVCMMSAMNALDDALPAEYRKYVPEYVRKPYDPSELIEKVARCLSTLG